MRDLRDPRAFVLVDREWGPRPEWISEPEWEQMIEGSMLYARARLGFAIFDARQELEFAIERELRFGRLAIKIADGLAWILMRISGSWERRPHW